MSAKKQIRLYCRWCMMESYSEIEKCPVSDCSLHPFRLGETIKGTSKQKAIRKKCIDCLQHSRPGTCVMKSCQLFDYRDGHRPSKVENTEEIIPKKQISAEHIQKMQRGRAKKQILDDRIAATSSNIIKRRRIHVKV